MAGAHFRGSDGIFVLVYRRGKQQTIGVPMMANRLLTRQALTCKTNVVPLTLDIEDTASCRQLAQTTGTHAQATQKHQAFRYEEIKVWRSVTSRSPLFNIVVNIIPFEAAASFSLRAAAKSVQFTLQEARRIWSSTCVPISDNQTLRLEIDDSGALRCGQPGAASRGYRPCAPCLYHDPEKSFPSRHCDSVSRSRCRVKQPTRTWSI
ncbi:hypothetical protein M8494_11995 [Serratia ureilytica]